MANVACQRGKIVLKPAFWRSRGGPVSSAATISERRTGSDDKQQLLPEIGLPERGRLSSSPTKHASPARIRVQRRASGPVFASPMYVLFNASADENVITVHNCHQAQNNLPPSKLTITAHSAKTVTESGPNKSW